MGEDRLRRVGKLIQEEIAQILQRGELPEELPAFVTVTDVRVAPDLRTARVAVSVYADEEQQLEALEVLTQEAWRIRKLVGGRIRLKYTPELRFELDGSYERADRLEEIFDEIAADEGSAPENDEPAA